MTDDEHKKKRSEVMEGAVRYRSFLEEQRQLRLRLHKEIEELDKECPFPEKRYETIEKLLREHDQLMSYACIMRGACLKEADITDITGVVTRLKEIRTKLNTITDW